MFSKKIAACLMAALLCCGCSINNADSKSDSADVSAAAADSETVSEANAENNPGTQPSETDDVAAEAVEVIFENGGATLKTESDGITAENNVVKITAAGKYYFSGELEDGQILVEADKESKVDIYLDGVKLGSSTTAPIRVESADGCTIHLVEGSTNVLSDTAANAFSACISAKDDITIKGKGTLYVYGNAKHAIKSSNDVKVKNGVLLIQAVKTGIYGEDKVQITGGNITFTACKDAIKAVDDADPNTGVVTIEEAEIDIQNAQGNGIEAAAKPKQPISASSTASQPLDWLSGWK